MEFLVKCGYKGDGHSGMIKFRTERKSMKAILIDLKEFIFRKFADSQSIEITSFNLEFDEWKDWQNNDGFAYENLLDFIRDHIEGSE